MRRFVNSFGVKLISFILFVLLVCSLFLSAVAVYALIESEVYYDGGERLYDSIYSNYCTKYDSFVQDLIHGGLLGYDVSNYEYKLSEQYTNYRYRVYDDKDKLIFYNSQKVEPLGVEYSYTINAFFPDSLETVKEKKVFDDHDELNRYLRYQQESESVYVVYPDVIYNDDGTYTLMMEYYNGETRPVRVESGVLKEPLRKDVLYYELKLADVGIAVRDYIFIYVAAAALCCLILLVILMCGAGRKNGVEGVYLNKFNRIPFDLYLAVNGVIAFVGFAVMHELTRWDLGMMVAFAVGIPAVTVMGLALLLTFTARVKGDGWYKNTVIYMALRLAYKVIGKIPLFYRTLLVLIGLSVFEIFFLAFGARAYVMLWFMEKLTVIPLVIYCVICMRGLQKGAKKMAEGDTEYRTNTSYMIMDFKEHGRNLNNIGNGLRIAVEKSVKSERMKAELITNVSHDIKTPLTSIVNYVDLLKKEGLEGPNAPEYLEVLERQSDRLKRLTEDLVEASKASTGNVAINAEPTDINVLLEQMAGEYEERLNEKGLALVLDKREEELIVNADGRHTWRVFDNLMNNICKYAQSGTRVYVTAEKAGEKAVIAFRNISREPLNIDPTELTERFVRGDRSRNTEGSGLGLSIARSLIELQGGEFQIQIDGDLFKAVITL